MEEDLFVISFTEGVQFAVSTKPKESVMTDFSQQKRDHPADTAIDMIHSILKELNFN